MARIARKKRSSSSAQAIISGVDYRFEMLLFHPSKLYRTRMQMAEGGLTQATRTAPEDEQNRLLTVKPRATNPDPRQRRRPSGPAGGRLQRRRAAPPAPRQVADRTFHTRHRGHRQRAAATGHAGRRRRVLAGNTIFVITRDCGRDVKPLAEIPFQNYFNSRSAHVVWAVIFGPGIGKAVIERPVDQSAIVPTIAAAMGFAAFYAEGKAREAAFL